MKRRSYLRSIGAGTSVLTAGCLGFGGEAVVSIQQSIDVEPGSGWVEAVPDVSDPGGAISYVIRSSDSAFDVYLFVEQESYEQYETFTREDEDPSETPGGHAEFSKAAVPKTDEASTYEAATDDGGAREPLDATGPYYFVVDHSNYRMENRVDEYGDPLSVFVDLEVVQNHI